MSHYLLKSHLLGPSIAGFPAIQAYNKTQGEYTPRYINYHPHTPLSSAAIYYDRCTALWSLPHILYRRRWKLAYGRRPAEQCFPGGYSARLFLLANYCVHPKELEDPQRRSGGRLAASTRSCINRRFFSGFYLCPDRI